MCRRLSVSLLLALPVLCQTHVNVVTYHNNNARSGANLNETQLTLQNVAVGTFGKLFTLNVDGVVYAQPLYMSGLKIKGATHNVVFVATENNSVYAFDADAGGAPLWQTNFNYGASGVTVTPVPDADINCENVSPVVGITSTPVIDTSNFTLYVVAKTKEVSNTATNYYHRLHGLNILTGKEVFTQVEITASVPGKCGSTTGTITFDPLVQHQRAGLLLSNGVVYIASGAHCDLGAYYGWLLGYNVTTQQQVAALNVVPDGPGPKCRGGIWQSGGAPAADTNGNIYVLTGNGGFNANKGMNSYGDSALKLSTNVNGGVAIADYFTPYNQQALNNGDLDFAGSGAAVILPSQPGPNPDLMVAAGKVGTIYLLNRDNMGKYNTTSDQVVQSIPGAVGNGNKAFTPPVYFEGSVYFSGTNDVIKGFSLVNGLLDPTPFATSETSFGYLGAGLSLSSAPGGSNAILWAINGSSKLGVLYAYNALTMEQLYNSNQAAGKVDNYGQGVLFSIPTVVNGKVYVGTQNSVAVFGVKDTK